MDIIKISIEVFDLVVEVDTINYYHFNFSLNVVKGKEELNLEINILN